MLDGLRWIEMEGASFSSVPSSMLFQESGMADVVWQQDELLERAFRDFEARREWRVSGPARVIIEQGLISLLDDPLGLGEIKGADARWKMLIRALEALPRFLDHLADIASPLADAARSAGDAEPRIIGGLLVVRHARTWAEMFGCSCWPE